RDHRNRRTADALHVRQRTLAAGDAAGAGDVRPAEPAAHPAAADPDYRGRTAREGSVSEYRRDRRAQLPRARHRPRILLWLPRRRLLGASGDVARSPPGDMRPWCSAIAAGLFVTKSLTPSEPFVLAQTFFAPDAKSACQAIRFVLQ